MDMSDFLAKFLQGELTEKDIEEVAAVVVALQNERMALHTRIWELERNSTLGRAYETVLKRQVCEIAYKCTHDKQLTAEDALTAIVTHCKPQE